ncbi:CRISPR-associated endonuclease Cas2 [Candidatus Daviesbacteria bacterium]|nr:CRISPR-associated endonuclease Cas2 [Candidatus Daviesbacteria bacterium]
MVKGKVKTKDVLKIIGVGGLVVASIIMPNLPMALMKVQKAWKNIKKEDLGRILKRLERQQVISIREKGDMIAVEITEKGKRRLLEYDFEGIEIKNKKRDGRFRLVVFDIPENKKNARDMFRRKLIQLGFIKLQESVFASAYPCKKEIDFLCHYLEISDYVTIASVDKIERGEQLVFKEYFYHDN